MTSRQATNWATKERHHNSQAMISGGMLRGRSMRLIESLFSVNTASEQQWRANFEMHDKPLVTLPFPFNLKIWIKYSSTNFFVNQNKIVSSSEWMDELQMWKFRNYFGFKMEGTLVPFRNKSIWHCEVTDNISSKNIGAQRWWCIFTIFSNELFLFKLRFLICSWWAIITNAAQGSWESLVWMKNLKIDEKKYEMWNTDSWGLLQ